MNWTDTHRGYKSYFYNMGLWGNNTINEDGWHMSTLGTILQHHQETNVSITEAHTLVSNN